MTNEEDYDIQADPESDELITLAVFPDAMSAGFFKSLLEEEDIYAFIQNESEAEASRFNLQVRRGDAVAAYEIMRETIERARAGAEDEELEFGAEYDALDDSDDDEESSDSPERDGYDDDPVTVEAEDVQEIEPEAGDMSGLRLLMGILIFILVLLVLGHVANML